MKGFTLIEILVSVAIFSVAMVIALGALLTMSVADRKAESLKSVINNLNFAVDSMSRAVRVGTDYSCTASPSDDCPSGSNYFTFTSYNGKTIDYRLNSSETGLLPPCQNGKGCIQRQVTPPGGGFSDVTSPEVVICDFSSSAAATATCPQVVSPAVSYLFYLVGSDRGPIDTVQPKLVITLNGVVQVTPTQTTSLHLQTTVTQRIYDL